MKIKNLLTFGTKKLNSALRAEILLSFILKKSKEYLFTWPNKKVNQNNLLKYKRIIKKCQKGVPIPYLTKEKEFYGFNFYINKNVLIPRPESELIIDTALKFIPRNRNFVIADIGTGSGCLAITLAKLISPKIKIYALDISKKALDVAKFNAEKHRVKNIKFIKSDLLKNLPEKANLIIANLPYVKSKKIIGNLKFEPKIALDGGKDGLEIIKKFLKQAVKYLKKNGKILIEFSPEQKIKIIREAKKYFKKVKIKKDLSGKNRLAIISEIK